MLESLEHRRLLHGHIDNGVLTIEGRNLPSTANKDVIIISQGGGFINANLVNEGQVLSFPDTGIYKIEVLGYGGNDLLKIDDTVQEKCVLRGGDGDDTLKGHTGPDSFIGADGTDTVTYASRTEPLSLSLDGVTNDGAANELDNIKGDVDVIIGGTNNDVIRGNDSRNKLYGGNGNDKLVGNGDLDLLSGGAGNDTLVGGTGADTMQGGAGADTITAKDGVKDIIDGGTETDVLLSKDTVDSVTNVP